MSDAFLENIWAPATFFKLLALLAAYPIWGAVLKAMWAESKHAWQEEHPDAVRGAFVLPRPHHPGRDPWESIPHSDPRASGGAPRSSGAARNRRATSSARPVPARQVPSRSARAGTARARTGRRRGF
jgi:hypothetical protein